MAAFNENGGRLAPTPECSSEPGPTRLFGGSRQWRDDNRQWRDGHVHPVVGLALERHVAVHEGEKGVIAPQPDIVARLPLDAALAEDDVAGQHGLPAGLLDADPPAFGIAA